MNEYLKHFNKIKEKDRMNMFKVRYPFCKKYSWAIPSEEAINIISKYSPIIEIGCGSAYWAKLLQENGCDIIPVDKHPKNNPYRHEIKWIDILEGDEEILKQTPSNMNLFLCWPPYDKPMAYNCLKNFEGEYLIYIGEDKYGCTADDTFFDELDENWKKIEYVKIPKWDRIYDSLKIYERK